MRYRTSSLLLRPLRTKPSTDSRRIRESGVPAFGGERAIWRGRSIQPRRVSMIPAPVYHALSALVPNSRHRPPLSCKGTFRCAAIWLCLSLAISHRPHPFHDVIPDPSLYPICMKALFHLVWLFLIIFVLFFRLFSSRVREFPTNDLLSHAWCALCPVPRAPYSSQPPRLLFLWNLIRCSERNETWYPCNTFGNNVLVLWFCIGHLL